MLASFGISWSRRPSRFAAVPSVLKKLTPVTLPAGRLRLVTRPISIGVAGSTGRRNTGVKFLCRGFKSQGLAWPLIELAGHFVEMGLRVHRQVGSFRKVLSQQAIGVLVGTALPRTLRIAKVNIDVGR